MHWAQTKAITLNASLAAYNKMAAFYPTVLEYQGTDSGKRFTTLVPVGLSIQNARTTYLALLAYNTTAYDDKNLSYTTDAQIGLQRDGGHVSFNIGRYIAALTLAGALTGQDISDITWHPTAEGGYSYPVTEAEQRIAIESAVNALANPLEITESQYKTAP